MKLNVFTIVLDGMPFIEQHLATYSQFDDWHWTIVEGASGRGDCTAWCAAQAPRLSVDGTHEYLKKIAAEHPEHVTHLFRPDWPSKLAMCNAAVDTFGDGILLQADADEIWRPAVLKKALQAFMERPDLNGIRFKCRYYVGPDIITCADNAYGNNAGEWMRMWRFRAGQRFNRHEPPILDGNKGLFMGRAEAEHRGLIFDHYAWYNEAQVAYKEKFYNYPDAVRCWKRLQQNQRWPIVLKRFLPWVDNRAMAMRIST